MEYGNRPRDRDSHDLTAVQLARFSVVDSMLLSLAGIPGENPIALPSSHDPTPRAQPDLDDPYVSPRKYSSARAAGRPRGHTHSSSMSDYDSAHIDDLSRSYTVYHSHTQPRLHAPPPLPKSQKQNRTDSARDAGGVASVDVDSLTFKRRKSKGHRQKGSNGSSLDMGPPSNTWARGPNRAASFDYATREGGLRSTPKRAMRPPPLTMEPDYDMDAAPTPSVPSGPRRHRDTISSAMAPPPVTPRKGPTRQNSGKSTKTMKKGKSGNFQDPAIREQAKQFVNTTNSLRVGTSYGGTNSAASAPSPTVGGPRKSVPSPPTAQNQPKERQGFFRRVFGSSKNQHVDELVAQARAPSTPIQSERPKTQPSQQHHTSHSKSGSRPPTQDPHSSSRGELGGPHQTLRKSSSSFFRRRKKSIGGTDILPPVPPLQLLQQHVPPQSFAKLHLGPQLQGSESESSLRNVMAPFLADHANTSPLEGYFGSRDHRSNDNVRPTPDAFVNGKSNNPSSLRVQELADAGRIHAETDRSPAANADRLLDGEREVSSHTSSLRTLGPQRNGSSKDMSRSAASSHRNSPNGLTFLAESSTSEDGSRANTTSSDHEAMTALMPTRPAPTPSSPTYLQAARNMEQTATPGERDGKKTTLSPISDHSLPSNGLAAGILDPDEEFILLQITNRDDAERKFSRVFLKPTASDERLNESSTLSTDDPLKPELPSPTSDRDFSSVVNLPTLQIENRDADMELTEQDRDWAQKIFNGDESVVTKAGAASWLGQTTARNARTRTAYMELYDWRGVNILHAFRELCSRLVVRAESQQLDRVIDAFSERWCECNPNHGFKDRDVVLTITFSLLMLNTDLHLADMEQRMTKSQFVKNTLPTIRSIAEAASFGPDETVRTHSKSERGAIPWDMQPATTDNLDRPSLDTKGSRNRHSRLPIGRSDSEGHAPEGNSTDGCNILVHAPTEGSIKGWEKQVEVVLKEFYESIRSVRLPLHGSSVVDTDKNRQQSNASLSVITSALHRTPSVLSKTPSDKVSYRGRPGDMRSATARFSSKSRTRRGLYPSSTIGSSRTSLDDQSLWSPAASTWTKHSLGKTQTSFSVESLGSLGQGGGYQQAIGFANALSQAIIREEGGLRDGMYPQDGEMDGRVVPLLEDETLGLHGPPWAKEGILRHKYHLETLGKKAKDRGWTECFAVIEKGQMRLFSFPSQNSHSSAKGALRHLRSHHKPKPSTASGSSAGQVFGGGNWTENAEALDRFVLRQTIANVLPHPGYSKSRPHVWALSLPTGAVHLFSVGSTELGKEWVTTANYWSARLSKEPLVGGVSNVEYGWGDNIISNVRRPESSTNTIGSPPATAASASAINESPLSISLNGNAPESGGSRSSSNNYIATPSSQPRSSIIQSPGAASSRPPSSLGRSSVDQGHWGNRSARLPGDKSVILEWRPPAQSMMASQLMEVDQRNALLAYVTSVENELKRHNELRGLMGMAFSPRHPNASKAMNNWERKSAYLLKEIIKFQTYIEALNQASLLKEKVYAERAESEALRKTVEDDMNDGEQEKRDLQLNQHDIDFGGDLEKDTSDSAGVDVLLQG